MSTTREARRLTRILELFRQHDERMSVSEALVFLMAADDDKFEHQKDIEDRLGIANSTCSRYVSYWSGFVRPDEPGRGMIENYPDPMNRSSKKMRLLPKGKAFLAQVADIIKGD